MLTSLVLGAAAMEYDREKVDEMVLALLFLNVTERDE